MNAMHALTTNISIYLLLARRGPLYFMLVMLRLLPAH